MKIGSTPDTTAIAPASTGARTAAAAAPAPLAPAAAADQVDVSPAGVQLARAADGGDFDQAKVDAIRLAIREGRFTVNAGAIADQLISDAAALIAPRHH